MKVDFKDNSEVLIKLIERVILPKYNKLSHIENIVVSTSSFRGDSYFVYIVTNECLSTEEMMEIDTEAKTLFKMASLPNVSDNPFNVGGNKVMLFFDCGDGEGFVFSSKYGYIH